MQDSFRRTSCVPFFLWQCPFICKAHKNAQVHEPDLF